MSSRRVVIDDTSPQIQYMGTGWFFDNGSQDNIGTFGPTYQHTSHGTKLIFYYYNYPGTGVIVLGTNNAENPSAVHGPTWECFIDNISISASPFRLHGNNQELCSTHMLEDGPHELTVNVTTTGQIFWLDSIQYSPSSMSLFKNSAVLHIDHTDPEIIYDFRWRVSDDIAHITETSGSTASFNFTGMHLSWIGLIPQYAPHIPSLGAYSIDGGPQVPFHINSLNDTTLFNQELFSTPELPEGPHTLQVTYQGDGSQTPLALYYLYVTTGPSPENTVPSNISISTTELSTSTRTNPSSGVHSSSTHGLPVGAIAGGAVGGTTLIILILALFFWYKRKYYHTWNSNTGPDVTPYSYDTVNTSSRLATTAMPIISTSEKGNRRSAKPN